jgi:predicted permease
LTNLSLAQQARREAEFALRATLGGTRGRLAYQLALESVVLAVAGGALGLGFAVACQQLLRRFLARLTPRAFEIELTAGSMLAAVALALLLGLAIGLLPALGRRRDLFAALRDDAPGTTASGRSRTLRDGLVVLQVAVSFVLLIGAGLLLRSLWNLERISPGFAHAEVVTLDLPHNWTKYGEDEAQIAYADRLLAAVRAVPGVESAALADTYPLHSDLPWNRRVAVGTTPPDPQQPGPEADFRMVSPGYFATVGVPLVAGRELDESDRDPELAAVVVNAAFARALFADRDPLGERVSFAGGNTAWTIVGVVADVRQRALGQPPKPELFAPIGLTGGGGLSLLVRSPIGLAVVRGVRAAVRGVDPEQPITGVRTLAAARADALVEPRTTAVLLAIAATLALVIAAAGLAGLLAYTLGQRHREFGIRLALGATRGDIARLVLGRTAALVGLGGAIGLGGALAATRGLDSMLFGLAANDPTTYLAVATVLGSAALLAALPTLGRAVRTAPSLALRVT